MLTTQREPDEQAVRFGSFVLDIPARSLVHGADAVALTPKELDVLVVLVLLRGQLVPKDDLILHAWGGEPISDSALFQTVYRLRRALAQYDTHAEYIATVPGRGYQFVAPVEVAASIARSFDVAGDVFGCYRRGMFEFHQRTQRSLTAAIALFRRALRLDPQFVPAYVGIAHAHLCLAVALLADHTYCYHRALRASHNALAIDPYCGDAYAMLAEVHIFFEADVKSAQRAVRRALELAPNSPRVKTAAFWAFLTANDIDEALRQVRDALTIDPSSNHFTTLLGVALYYARRLPEAHVHLMDAHLFRPADSMALFYDGCVLALMGDYDAAQARFAQMERADRATRVLAVQAWMAAQRGQREIAHEIVAGLESLRRTDDVALALALTAVGRLDEAARHARSAAASNQTSCYLIPIDPFFEPLHRFMTC
jgi:DNA-binding winged helix-turn-helix (wHTH) protein/tetratricopeptide (TPR) repeat protein